MNRFSEALLGVFEDGGSSDNVVHAWCVLPNHYHVLVTTFDLAQLLQNIGRLHGRTSHAWNREENLRGRKVFYRTSERELRSRRHFLATLNYVHHNPVRHGYAEKGTEWPWSSATEFLRQKGAEEVDRIHEMYPLLDYGENWDAPEI